MTIYIKILVIFVLNTSLYKPLDLNVRKLKTISKETQVSVYIVDFSRDAYNTSLFS